MKDEISPLVSVVVSCYNHENYIKESLLSVLNQTYQNVELIVFDDGSVDKSADIIEALSKEYSFFFQRQKNIGLTATSNKAIKLCKGKYVAFLGSDDVFLEDKLQTQVHFMEERDDIAGCGGSIVYINEKGELLKQKKRKPYREVDFQMIFNNRKAGPPAPTAMIRLDVLRDIGGYDPGIRLEDLYLWLKITHHGHRLAVLPDDMVYYRKHAFNTHKNYKLMADSMIEIYKLYHNEQGYLYAINKVIISMFLKVSRLDKLYAMKLLKEISPRYYNLKVLRGVWGLIVPRKDSLKTLGVLFLSK